MPAAYIISIIFRPNGYWKGRALCPTAKLNHTAVSNDWISAELGSLSVILSATRAAIFNRRLAGPALERSVEDRAVRKAEQKRDFSHGKVAVSEVT
jgi:hypothetical protein